MRHFYNLVKKEVKELLTREVIVSMVFMLVFFVFMGRIIKGAEEEAKEINISILDLDRTPYLQNILNIVSKQGIEINSIEAEDIENAIKEAKEKNATVLLVIPPGFGVKIQEMEKAELEMYSIMKGLSIKETISSEIIKSIIGALNKSIATSFIQKAVPDKDPEDILSPIHTKDFVVIKERTIPGTPGVLFALITSQSIMIPLILVMVIMYTGMMVMTSMGSEKESKTLETLLSLPIGRGHIIAGKMAGSAIIGFMMTIVYMGGVRYYMSPMMGAPEISIHLKDLGLSMTSLGYLLLGTSLFLAILAALSGCIILGVFAQDTKSAQTMSYPIMLLAFIPFFLSMFKDIETLPLSLKIIVYAIPFSHPMIASKSLIFHDYSTVLWGIGYMAIFIAITMWIGVRIFNTDKVLTARFAIRRKKIGR
ncbi:ABC transporter permease [candidate division WOR-3 bacterium]|nr:ABC transporter permease [candidate division WOR-3 bacterium]